jgi:hypothetical protein
MVSGEMEPLIVTFPVTLPVPVSVLSAASAGTAADHAEHGKGDDARENSFESVFH